ncbi:MAG: tryptophan-rich sensory protein [Microbacteriaceae bacterium]|nr:tryptophan-rich sensory protein [Microbacteriaceae bacterium]
MTGFARALAWTGPAVAAAAAIGGIATKETKSVWYRTLDTPPFQPPAPVFPIAWTALYASTALAGAAADAALVERQAPDEERRREVRGLRLALIGNLVLNAGWCWMFFKWRRLGAATAVAGALAASTADLARRAGRARRGAGIALIPYSLWTGFATVLTDAIRRRNPGRSA